MTKSESYGARQDVPFARATPYMPQSENYSAPPPSAPTERSRPPTRTVTSTIIPPASAITSHPPPGVADGGVWGKTNDAGANTWLICALLCLVGGPFVCFGAPAFCCPCDEKDVYRVNGKVYSAAGKYLGTTKKIAFEHLPRWSPTPAAPAPPDSSLPPVGSITTSETILPDGRRSIVRTTYNPDGSKTVQATTES